MIGNLGNLGHSGRLNSAPSSSYAIYSPRSVGGVNDTSQTKFQRQTEEKTKVPLFKKNQGIVEEGETVATNNNSIRNYVRAGETGPLTAPIAASTGATGASITSTSTSSGSGTYSGMNGNQNLREKSLKFHQEIVRGLNISRSMGLNH
jgi:hypothetical protein